MATEPQPMPQRLRMALKIVPDRKTFEEMYWSLTATEIEEETALRAYDQQLLRDHWGIPHKGRRPHRPSTPMLPELSTFTITDDQAKMIGQALREHPMVVGRAQLDYIAAAMVEPLARRLHELLQAPGSPSIYLQPEIYGSDPLMAYKYEPPAGRSSRETRADIEHELELWQRMGVQIGSRDYPIPNKIGGNTATVRFQREGGPVEFICDTWGDYEVNLRCCYLAIQSMRLNEARGIGETMARAYGYLPAPAQHKDPYEVLGVHSTMDLEDIEVLYRNKARRLGEGHPDLKDLNVAMDRIREEKRA